MTAYIIAKLQYPIGIALKDVKFCSNLFSVALQYNRGLINYIHIQFGLAWFKNFRKN